MTVGAPNKIPPGYGAAVAGEARVHAIQPTNGQLLRRMMRFVLPVRGIATAAGVMVIVWMILDVCYTRLTGTITNAVQAAVNKKTTAPENFSQAIGHEPLHSIMQMILILGVLVLLQACARFIREFVNAKFTMDIVFHMRAEVYDRLQRVGFAFHDEHSSGALINRALSDLQNVRGFLQMGVLLTVEIFAFAGGYWVVMLLINKWLAIAALVPVPFWIWYVRRFSRRMQPRQMAQMQAGDDLVTVFTENVAGVHVVKAFATEKTEIGKYNRAADVAFEKIMDTVLLWRNFVPMIQGGAGAANLALIAIGAVLVVTTRGINIGGGGVQVGDLLVVGTAMATILSRLQQINNITEQYQKAVTSARRFFEVLDAPPTVLEKPDAPDLPQGSGSVEFHFVNFGYDRARPIVKDIAFEIPGGMIVALVGPTGSGKSTIMQLLARFYDPQRGQVFIDNTDIRNVNLKSLHSEIGFVFQETFLFSDTVANNIRYKYPDASIGAVEAAARIAQAHDFIMELPKGYDTMLGERGLTLSGGQRQRLAIARGIISNPRILVLDDALAAVDPETEYLISKALEHMMVHRTVFIIAHRLSTVKAADLVIVLEDGRITQAGTHQELMAQTGHYRQIAEVQLAYQEREFLARAKKSAAIEARKE